MSLTSSQRQQVRDLAGGCCEYCRVAEPDRFSRFQIDHVIPLKHGGSDDLSNLALACLKCNAFKGPNVAALDQLTGQATKLFHPREQVWDEHFSIQPDGNLRGLTPEGRATIAVLRINDANRVAQRQIAITLDEYPCQPDHR